MKDFHATIKADRLDTEFLVDVLRKNESTLTDRIALHDPGADIFDRNFPTPSDKVELRRTQRLIHELQNAKITH
jgi:hypothetical protein